MGLFARIGAAIAPLFLLSACLLTPGKFTSTLDIRADRSFTFTYKGEVIASDPGEDMKNMGAGSGGKPDDGNEGSGGAEEEGAAYYRNIAAESGSGDNARQAELQAMAEALSKEAGYRSVRYLGGDKFEIDYAISGRLDHGFVFPFNIDARAVFPFVAIELRKDGKARVRAPGFASDDSASGGPMGGMGADKAAKEREGTFTLTTDAEIVSQNQEEGAKATPGGKQLVWKITPLTRIAPMAVVQFKGE